MGAGRRRHGRWALVAAAWGALVLGAAVPAGAAEDVFTVRAVAVDVTADTAAAARTRALAEGQSAALRRLLSRLTLAADWSRLPAVGEGDVAALVQALEVDREKVLPTRYVAALNVRFRADAVRALLRDHGIAFSETVSKPVVVLPLYAAEGSVILWEEPNPWRAAWLAGPEGADRLVPLVVPIGDLTDIVAVRADTALAGDAEPLLALARRYEAGDVLIAQASPGTAGLDLTLRRVMARGGVVIDSVSLAGAPAELFAAAVAAVSDRLEEEWKQATVARGDAAGRLSARVALSSLDDWLTIRERLRRTPAVSAVELGALRTNDAQVILHFFGAPQQIVLAVEQQELSLEIVDGFWLLRRAETPAPIGSAAAPDSR